MTDFMKKVGKGMKKALKKAGEMTGGLMASVRRAGNKPESPGQSAEHGSTQTRLMKQLRSVGGKLFLIIFVGIIICVMTVGLVAHSRAKSIVENQVSEASFQTVNQVTNNLDIVFQSYADLSLQVLIDKDIQEQLNTLEKSSDQFEALQASRSVSDRLTNYVMGNTNISGAALIPVSKDLNMITVGSTNGKKEDILAEAEWFKNAQEQQGRVLWIEPQEGGLIAKSTKDTIGLARMVKPTGLKEPYVFVVEINMKSILDRYSDVNFGEGSELAIISADNKYIVSNQLDKIGQPFKVALPTEGEQAVQGRESLKTTDGDKVLAAYQTSEQSGWRFVATIPVEKLVEDAEVIRTLTWIMVGLAAVIAIGIGLLVFQNVAKPLITLRNLMREGARGNLTVRSSMNKRHDEIGELSESFNDMMKQITELAKQTTLSAEEVLFTANELTDASKKTAIAAKEIAVATEEIANGATSLAVEAEKGSDITNHMNDQMKNVIAANSEMAESASEVEKASEQGTTYMGQLIQKTGMTEEMTRSMVEKVDALKDSTGSIVKILDVLNNLTKQTNILSLNATIEAARAGAAGKGFMVVADEIRKLADQSRQSIDVVGQITSKIQGEIEETVKVLSEANPIFQEQIAAVKDANQIFLSVRGQMSLFTEKLEHATSSINTLNQSQFVLSEAMTSVSAVAEESSATSEEVASLSSEQLSISEGLVKLSEKLDSVSKGLKESLSKFKVE
ncbi:methyl-accepting chemotaxis protein [Paenibacillus nanensis]|nr:methyl-accepting chemotaxis protein [Paenibacillus nanensis]